MFHDSMYEKGKFLLFLLFSVNIDFTISQRSDDDNWPEDNTTPFPYPTPGPTNLNTSSARHVDTPTPLTFDSRYFQQSIATNSGHDLVIEPNQNEENEHALLTGGILYDDVYKFFQTEYFWDLELESDAADRLDDVGSPIEVAVSYFNTRYGSRKNAIDKRNGIAQIVFLIEVSNTTNFNFYPLQLQLQAIKEYNTSTLISEYLSFIWYHGKSSTDDYYAYPGMYLDPETGITHYSSTVIILVRTPQPSISISQFKSTFGSLHNEDEKSYSHILNAEPQGERPVVHSTGFVHGQISEKK